MSYLQYGLSTYIVGLAHDDFNLHHWLCSNAEARCPIFPGVGARLYWPFDDPAEAEGTDEEKLARFREIRDQIDEKIREWILQRKLKQFEVQKRQA